MKGKRFKVVGIIITLTLVVAFLVAGCGQPAPAPAPAPAPSPAPAPKPAPAPAPQFKLVNAEVYQPDHELGMLSKWFVDELEKRTNGRVKTQTFFGGSLAVGAETLKGLQEGAFDFATVIAIAYEGQLPLLSLLTGPFDTYSQYAAGMATNELIKTYAPMRDEVEVKNSIKLWTAHWPSAFAHNKKELKTPADMKGLKWRSIGSYSGLLENAGIRAIGGLPATDVYEALQRGMVEGAFPYPLSSYALERFYEVVPWLQDVGAGGYCQGGLGMSMKTWQKLPADIQGILVQLGDEYPVKYQEVSNQKVDLYLKLVKDGKGNVTLLTPKQIEEWRAVFKVEDWRDKKIAALEAKGLPARETVNRWLAAVAKYEKTAPPTQAATIAKALGK